MATLRGWLQPSPGHLLLDLGCGDGYWTSKLGQVAQTEIGIDLNPSEVSRAHRFYGSDHTAFGLANAQNLPFSVNAFDRAICLCALSVIANPSAALLELGRVIRPDGLLVLSVDSLLAPDWVSQDYRRYHSARFNTGRAFDLNILTADLCASGFEVLEHRWLLRSRWSAFWAMQQERFGWSVNWWFALSLPLSSAFDRLTPPEHPGLILLVLARRVANKQPERSSQYC